MTIESNLVTEYLAIKTRLYGSLEVLGVLCIVRSRSPEYVPLA